MEVSKMVVVGVDWAKRAHQVSVWREGGEVANEGLQHDPKAVAAFCDRLLEMVEEPSMVRIAIERPHGLLVDTFLGRGFRVFAINPKQLDRFRDRFSPSGAKDDRLDAKVAASALHSDPSAFQEVVRESPEIVELRELSREHDDLTKKRVQIECQIQDLLDQFYPQFDFPIARWSIALWKVVPTPQSAFDRGVRGKITRVLKKTRLRKHSTDSVLEQLRGARFEAADGVEAAAVRRLRRLFASLELLLDQGDENSEEIKAVIGRIAAQAGDGPSDIEIVSSMPGIGPYVLAGLFAEASHLLATRDYDRLRIYAGVAPVTKRSGRQLIVSQRKACNWRLREAVYHWARVSAQHDERTKEHYASQRTRGCTPGRAMRSVGDRLLKILCAMLENRTLYQRPSAA